MMTWRRNKAPDDVPPSPPSSNTMTWRRNQAPASPKPSPATPTRAGNRRRRLSMTQTVPTGWMATAAATVAPSFIRPNTPLVLTRQEFLEMQAERLRTEGDITFLLEDPEQFAKLKSELRRSGAVTNTVLKHGIHFYARSHAFRAAHAVA
ncbi:expressed unknown protein [Seminavis robusta]|uniref:Uncharacterized protein n=1 Tax=Seminavis robusta TaxID=568900 RepID=A0A9N8DXF7_9STRA|nr:expressed unknown protein [Seminavis robusta]|eukprot:Sro440_g143370.1 n/a (150) ;mRNA; r:11862-12311